MKRAIIPTCLVCLLLLLATQTLRAQSSPRNDSSSLSAGSKQETKVNYGAKVGFTSSLFLASKFNLNATTISEMQNNYKIGYSACLFMRINFKRQFIQPELSYTINRCNIVLNKPLPVDAPANAIPEEASITSDLHSLELPILWGYNIIKEKPYSLAVFAGPKLRYLIKGKSDITFENFDQRNLHEELYPFNLSATLGVAVAIEPIFFDFRYDIGLHNVSKKISYELPADATETTHGIRFNRRDNVLSFSLGVFF